MSVKTKGGTKILLPESAKFEIHRIGATLCDFVYEETPPAHAPEAALTATMSAMALALERLGLPLSVSRRGRKLRLSGRRVPVRLVATSLAGEFFAWSSLADVRLGDLYATAIAAVLGDAPAAVTVYEAAPQRRAKA